MAREPPKPQSPDEGSTRSTHDSLLRAIARVPADVSPATAPDPTQLAQFRIVGRLGSGGMGIVYRAMDERLQRSVALKVLPTAFQSDPARRRRLLQEARSAAGIGHPNIATVYEVGEAEGRFFIAMELVEGQTLRSRIAHERPSFAETMRIARQLLDALANAHDKGVVHCDLKPDNVMLDDRGHVKVLDFGLARLSESAREEVAPGDLAVAETGLSPSQEGRVNGTPGYMAPEQADGTAPDARADIFAFGVILYEMLAGVRPFVGRTVIAILVAVERDSPTPLRQHRPDVPAALEAVVARCLAKSRDDRYASARDVLDALAGGEPTATAATSGSPVVGRSSPRLWALGAVIVVALAAFASRTFLAKGDGTTSPFPISSAPAPKPSASDLLAFPPPSTKSPEAAAEYRRALTDLRDGVRRPQTSLTRAVQLDPELAAAHLRLSMAMLPPTSTSEYGEALRFRASLDARDQEILRAEEPVAASVPPDLVEAENRYAALHEARPLDVEILMRLAAIRGRRDPVAAKATFAALLDLAPTMAGAALAAGDNAQDADDRETASTLYQRCLDLSPMGTRCLSRLARLRAQLGHCDAYARDVTRILVLEPGDSFFREDGLSAALTTGASEDDVQAAIREAVRTRVGFERTENALLDGEAALWRGSMLDARDAFARADRASRDEDVPTALTWTFPQRLAIAEEVGDENDVRAITRAYVGARALTTENEFDAYALSAMRRHRLLPTDEILRLRDRWRQDATGRSAALLWLAYEGGLAVTEEDARAALVSGHDAEIGHGALDVNARLGHLLLLAHRYAEAISRLDLVASNCALFLGDTSYVPWIVPAAYDLGQAHEGLGEVQQACVAYRRALDRWGNATPRSTTADAARARWRALRCADAN
jgi:serine/threonine protein kinase